MKKVIKKRIKACLYGSVVLVALQSGSAWADCANIGGQWIFNVNAATPVIVDPTLPPGTSLGRMGQAGMTWIFNCTNATNDTYVRWNMIPEAINNGYLYELRVGGQPSGVGIRVAISTNGGPFLPPPAELQQQYPAGRPTRRYAFQVSYERTGSPVRLGPVESSGFFFTGALWNSIGPTHPSPTSLGGMRTGNIALAAPACSIDAGSLNQTVPLGNYTTTQLQGPTASTPWVPFRLVMQNCTDPSLLTDISFGLPADADSNNPALFSMNTGGPTGVGIAIARQDASNAAMLPGVVGTFPIVMTGGSYNFQARMVRTTAPLTSGQVNRPVTVLVNFR